MQKISSRTLFQHACRFQKTPRLPVWMMRQAGRYMASYQKIRAKHDFLTMCREPELAIEISLQPIQEINMDAAIMFSDILTPLEPMGVGLTFQEQHGPVLDLRNLSDLNHLQLYDVEESLSYIPQIVTGLRQTLSTDKALIGFCGAPYTLAAYLLESKHRRSFHKIRQWSNQHPNELMHILEILSEQMARYLAVQIECGADAVQIFDSWAGNLTSWEYKTFVLPSLRQTIFSLKEKLSKKGIQSESYSIILFVKNFQGSLADLIATGADILSLDESRDLGKSRKELNTAGFTHVPLQGNLSPFALYKNENELMKEIDTISEALDKTGHIFNLGHGIFPDIPETVVKNAVSRIISFGA